LDASRTEATVSWRQRSATTSSAVVRASTRRVSSSDGKGNFFKGKWAQSGYTGRVCVGWVRKKSLFDKNARQIAIFMAVSSFLSSCNLTGGTGVRGKVDPNWMGKVFNCFH
jgi:hypothetical protein